MKVRVNNVSLPHLLLLLVLLVLTMAKVDSQRDSRNRQGPVRIVGVASEREMPTVSIPGQGTVSGSETFLSRTQRVIRYLGIPYAQPPVGQLRFSPPVTDPIPSWQGIRNSSTFGPSCYQANNRQRLHEKLYMKLVSPILPMPPLSEDCLFLNIYVPNGNRPPDGWPVMVWLHSGDFNTGSPAALDASVFVAKQKVLVVTVAYRLNILGFFTTIDTESPGNYGMLDQIAALDWIREHIHVFDGSPDNIIVYGHSSGAVSVGLHMMSPLSKGKFDKAIAMSGDAINSVKMPQDERATINEVADRFGCYRRSTDLVACLRNVDVDVLTRETANIESWGPVFDADINNSSSGPFLSRHPRDINNNNFYAVPLITGFTNNEQALSYSQVINIKNVDGQLSINEFESLIREESNAALQQTNKNSTCFIQPELILNAVLFFYKPHPPTKDQRILRDRYLDLQTEKNYAAGLTLLANKVSSHPSKVQAFVYRFDYRARTQAAMRDVPDWAGVPHMFELPFMWGQPYIESSRVQWNSMDKRTADLMMSMLANFARTERTAEMSNTSAIDYKALTFWNEYYPKIIEAATNTCCIMTNTAVANDFDPVMLKSSNANVAFVLSILTYLFNRNFV